MGSNRAVQNSNGWERATEDTYWYARYNAESLLSSANGVQYPLTHRQQAQFESFLDRILAETELSEPPIRRLETLCIGPTPRATPRYTRRPTFEPRPIQSTLGWATPSNRTLTAAGGAWTNLAYSQLSLAFEDFGDPETGSNDVAHFYARLYGRVAQYGLDFAFLDDAVLRDERREREARSEENEQKLFLNLAYDATDETAVASRAALDRPNDYAAVLWFLSMMLDFAGSVGYDESDEEIDVNDVEALADMTARTVVDEFSPSQIVAEEGARGVGYMLSAVGWYGARGRNDHLLEDVERYADSLAGTIAINVSTDGRIERADETVNQAAVQAAVGQGMLWAAEGLGVDAEDEAQDVLDYLLDDSWNFRTELFEDELDPRTRTTLTVRDAGDIVGAINAADAILRRDDAREIFVPFFEQSIEESQLQRAQRRPSVDPDEEFSLPLPTRVGNRLGEPPVFNSEVAFDAPRDEWSVLDNAFTAAPAMYAASQGLWLGQIGRNFFPGRGIP